MADYSPTSLTNKEPGTHRCAVEISEKQAVATMRSSPLSSNDEISNPSRQSNLWKPSLFRIRPFVGLAALTITIVCLFASLGILLGSRGEPVSAWYFPPSVYLAIATAISNTALSAALAQAAPIRWWYKAYKGSTIRDLELEWEAGQSFPKAIIRGLQQGRYFSLLTLSSLIAALVVVDGPLLQRSSTVQSATVSHGIVQNMSITPELPTGFSGWWYPNNVLEASEAVTEVGKAFANAAPIRSKSGCEGSCRMKVQAPGVARQDCVTKRWPIEKPMLFEPNSSWGSGYDDWMSSKPLMFVGFFSFTPGMPMVSGTGAGPEEVMLTVGRTDIRDYNGAYIETNCTLRSAVIEYDITLKDHDISFVAPPNSGRVIALANNTHLNTQSLQWEPLTWVAFQIYWQIYTSANASFELNVPKGEMTYPKAETMNPMAMKHLVLSHLGSIVVSDPTDEVLNNVNELMFRGGVLAGEWGKNLTHLMDDGLHTNRSFYANQTLTLNVFESDLRWFAGAATIQIVALILILPVFWGWWELGLVDLTLSPFHLANLFEAPLLNNVNSAASVREIIRDVGNLHIKLGMIEEFRDRADSILDEKVTPNDPGRLSRLGIAESPRVAAPYKGMRFRG